MKPRRRRVLVFGWDGADWRVIQEAWRRGRLPALRSVAEGGQAGTLVSTVPPLTPPAWTSLVTGTDPGEHGVFGFVTTDPRGLHPVPVTVFDRKVQTLFQVLDSRGHATAMVTVPWGSPGRPLSAGAVVPGWDSPGDDAERTQPPGLARRLAPLLERRPNRLRRNVDEPRAVLSHLAEWVRFREHASQAALEEVDPDVFMVVFSESDKAAHRLWRQGDVPDALIEAYDQVDAAMGRLIARHAQPDDVVLVVSDHGAVPVRSYVNLGRVLLDAGLLVLRDEEARARSPHSGDGQPVTVMRRARRKLRRLALHRPPRAFGARFQSVSIDAVRSLAVPVGTDLVSLGVRIAPERSPDGDHGAIRDVVRALLENLKDPGSGAPAFLAVTPREDAYSGSWVQDAPDLILVPGEGFGVRFGTQARTAISPATVCWHREEGIYAVRGIQGLAPRLPISSILRAVLEGSGYDLPESPPSATSTETVSAEHAGIIEERLRELGYVE